MAKPKNIGDEIIQLRKSGYTYNAIAKKLNCAKSTVNYHCAKPEHNLSNIGHNKIQISYEIQYKIREYCKTHSTKEAVKHFDLSANTIKKYKKDKAT